MRRRTTSDDHLIETEIFNHNKFDVVFYRNKEKDAYVVGSGITPGPDFVEVPSKGFAILPTFWYTPRAFDAGHMHDPAHEIKGIGIDVTINYGNMKGIGNTLPSAPGAEVRHRRKRR